MATSSTLARRIARTALTVSSSGSPGPAPTSTTLPRAFPVFAQNMTGVDKLVQNVSAFLETVIRMKPASSKGTYLRSIVVSSTMGPGIKIDTVMVKDLTK